MARSGLGLGFTSAGLVWLVGSAIFMGSTCGFSCSDLADLSALVSSGVRGISGDAVGVELNNILGVISAIPGSSYIYYCNLGSKSYV